MPKISLGSWAFMFGPYGREPWDIERISRWAAEAGYDGIDLCGFRKPAPENVYDTPEKAVELGRLIRRSGVDAAGYASFCEDAIAGETEPEAFMRRFEKSVRFCVGCGVHHIRMDSKSRPVELEPEEYRRRFDRAVTNWRAAARHAAKYGITLSYEFEPVMWLNKPSEVKAVARAVNEPNFGIMLDLSHACTGAQGLLQPGTPEILPGGVIEYIDLIGDDINAVHIIDTDGKLYGRGGAGTSVHLSLGKGSLDLDACTAALWRYASDIEYWSVDYFASDDVEETGPEAVEYLQRRFSELSK